MSFGGLNRVARIEPSVTRSKPKEFPTKIQKFPQFSPTILKFPTCS